MKVSFKDNTTQMSASFSETSAPIGSEKDYEKLNNLPRINGVELVGDKSLEELGINQQDLSDYAKKSEIPKNVSELNNDKGYLTEHQSLNGYVTEEQLNAKGYLTQHQDISGKADKSDIPTKTSQLENDSGYLTKHQSLEGYVKEVDLEAKGYLTEHQDISGKADKSEIVTVQTIQTMIDTAIGDIENGTY